MLTTNICSAVMTFSNQIWRNGICLRPFCFVRFYSLCDSGPHFAAVNNNNEIIVTDFHNHSVKVSTASASIGKVWVFWSLLFEMHIVILSSYKLEICCFYMNRQVFNTEGEFLLKFGSNGEGNGQFNAPTGVAVDVNGNIIVADWGNSRIQVSMRHFTPTCLKEIQLLWMSTLCRPH